MIQLIANVDSGRLINKCTANNSRQLAIETAGFLSFFVLLSIKLVFCLTIGYNFFFCADHKSNKSKAAWRTQPVRGKNLKVLLHSSDGHFN